MILLIFTFFVSVSKPAFATVSNGDFETGTLSGWGIFGDARVVGPAFGTGSGGAFSALITSHDVFSGSDFSLELFLGLAPGTLDALVAATSPALDGAFQGSVIRQTVTVAAGDTMSFDANFLTNEFVPSGFYNDAAFVTFDETALLLNAGGTGSISASFVPSASPFANETGFLHFSRTFHTAGTHVLGFGVVDVGDEMFDSALLIDNVRVTPGGIVVAEPVPAAVFGAGLVGLGLFRRSRSNAR